MRIATFTTLLGDRLSAAHRIRHVGTGLSLLLAALVTTGPGCSDDEGGGPSGAAIDTLLSPRVLLLGQSTRVTCAVSDASGNLVEEATAYATLPAGEITGDLLKPTAAGVTKVTCQTADDRLIDPSPADLIVIGEGDRDRLDIETTLSKNTASIGEAVSVTCAAYFDNAPLDGIDFKVEATPEAGITIADRQVTGTADGDFDIACRIVDSTFADETPERLVVGKGGLRPTKVVTGLNKSPIAAGESTTVACTVYDQNGDVMQWDTIVTASDDGVQVSGNVVEGRTAGEHTITCEVPTGASAVETVPATLVVTPAVPATFKAWAEPAKPVYKPEDVVTIKWEAKDGYGNPVPSATATVTAPAGTQKEGAPNAYRLLADGNYVFKVSLDGDANLSDEVELLVDGSGPIIIITSPDRGQTLTGDTLITVTGEVTDEWGGVATLEVNGVPVTPSETGAFTTQIDSSQGLNLVVARATDKHGNAGKASVAWYFSSAWAVADALTPELAWLDNSLRVWLSQELLDDYDHAEQKCDENNVCSPKIDDLATLLEIILTNVDLAALLGQPVLFEQVFADLVNVDLGVAILKGDLRLWADISTIRFGTAQLNLDSRNGGIDMKAMFVPDNESKALEIGLSVHIRFDLMANGQFDTGLGFAIPFSAGLDPSPEAVSTALLTIDTLGIDSSFDINASGGVLNINGQKVGLEPGDVTLSPLADVGIDLGNVKVSIAGFGLVDIPLGTIDLTQLVSGLDTVISSIASPILTAVLDLIGADILDPLIAYAGGDLIEGFLSSLEIDQTIDIPELIPGQPPAAIAIGAKISDVQFTDAGGRLGLTGRAVAEKKVDANPLGSILRDGCLGAKATPYQLPQTGPMEVAIGMDLLNEVLYGLWYTGGLNLTITGDSLGSLIGGGSLPGAIITLEPKLAPILSDCNSKGTLRLQLGDAYIDASLPLGDLLIDFSGWISIEVDVALTSADGKLGIKINGITAFDLTVTEIDGAFKNDPQGLEDLLKNLLNGVLSDVLGESLSGIEIPAIELDGLAPGVPPGTAIKLDGLDLVKSNGFFQLEGSLQ
ncbi:MAG: hypothetical protein IV100_19945 [Myxococcales bacterium]|nr:hypothetical protein [Myxococcales bacterium]